MKRMRVLAALLFAAALLSSCGRTAGGQDAEGIPSAEETSVPAEPSRAPEDPLFREIFAMDTVMDLTLYGERAEEAMDAAEAEVRRLEALLSAEDPDSEIGKLNRDGTAEVGEETGMLIEKALETGAETGGAFDIAVYPLVRAYGFPTGEYRIPDEEEIDALLPLLDAGGIRYDKGSGTVSFEKPGMAADLGGIAKGYAGDRIAALLAEYGTESALLNLGGNVQAVGSKPDGSPWKIGVRDPLDPENIAGVLKISDCAVVSAGGYERNFTIDGVTVHHIFDPETGRSAQSGLAQVTVVTKSGTEADALSTALFVMGKEKALAFLLEKDGYEGILVEDDGTVTITEGLAETFSSDRPVDIASR